MAKTSLDASAPDFKAIPTMYKGIQLKSRMEAQCAVLFDKLGWTWEYEKFSLMLPSGVTYIPDFWCTSNNTYPWVMVECRGYNSKRGDRQLNEFAEWVESGKCELPDGDGDIHDFIVIGPDTCLTYSRSHIKRHPEDAGVRPLLREPWRCLPAMIIQCKCGWMLANQAAWCPNCETRATKAAIITAAGGKIFLNGIPVEDL